MFADGVLLRASPARELAARAALLAVLIAVDVTPPGCSCSSPTGTFPTGGFAHSARPRGGLAARRGDARGASRDASSRRVLAGGPRGVLPFVRAAHRRAGAARRARRAGRRLSSRNHVANRASRAQGRALVGRPRRAVVLRSAALPAICDAALARAGALRPPRARVRRRLRARSASPLDDDARARTSTAPRAACCRPRCASGSSARSRRSDSSRRARAGSLERVLAACAELGVDDAAQTAPLIDLLRRTHDRLYSRLFQS